MTSRPFAAAPILAVLAIVLLPVTYVAVIGPVLWLSESGYLPEGIPGLTACPRHLSQLVAKPAAWLHAYARLCVPERAVDKYPARD